MYRFRRPDWFALNEPRHYLILLGILAAVGLVIGGVRWTMTAPQQARQEQEQQRQHQQAEDFARYLDACHADRTC
ncbi:hypothetical protein [Amycolatopsis kentuckyensis]|uniref:hypothetical protein n=1 Tax=Amycolatopsis kentuckyensis TaxID=218823 RepID=UPI0011784476|nr:hypothetical protein [Amycolatopsis kentuckyensis]